VKILKWNCSPKNKPGLVLSFPSSRLFIHSFCLLFFFPLFFSLFGRNAPENKNKKDLNKKDLILYLIPVPCNYPTCSAQWIHGKISLNQEQTALLDKLSVLPIESPDWIGWVEGRHEGVGVGIDYVCDRLIVQKKKKGIPRQLTLTSAYPFIEAWLFCRIEGLRDMAVGLRSRDFNGQILVEVFDLDTGRRIKAEDKLEASFGRTAWEQLLREDVDFLPYVFHHAEAKEDYPVAIVGKVVDDREPAKKTTVVTLLFKSGKRAELRYPGVCRNFKIARNGTAGWIRETQSPGGWSFLEFYKAGDIFLRIFGKYPQLIDWYFEKEGQGVVFGSTEKNKAPFYERYDLTLGKRLDSEEQPEYDWIELKPWAKPIESEGKTIFWSTQLELKPGTGLFRSDSKEPLWVRRQ